MWEVQLRLLIDKNLGSSKNKTWLARLNWKRTVKTDSRKGGSKREFQNIELARLKGAYKEKFDKDDK